MVVCQTEETRSQLKEIVTTSSDEIVLNTPGEIRHSVTVVGLQNEYDKNEVVDMLVKQNGFIREFTHLF